VALLIFNLPVFCFVTSFVCSLRAMLFLPGRIDRFTEQSFAGAAAHVAARIQVLEPNRLAGSTLTGPMRRWLPRPHDGSFVTFDLNTESW
jgi:hypothetical protein